MKFIDLLLENNSIQDKVNYILDFFSDCDENDIYDQTDLNNFGNWLCLEFYEFCDCENEIFSFNDIEEIIVSLSKDNDAENCLDYIISNLDDIDAKNYEGGIPVTEAQGLFLSRNRNKNRRKKMGHSQAFMKRTAVQRKRENRITFMKRKRERMKRKVFTKRYQKMYHHDVKKGLHVIKGRKKTGGIADY